MSLPFHPVKSPASLFPRSDPHQTIDSPQGGGGGGGGGEVQERRMKEEGGGGSGGREMGNEAVITELRLGPAPGSREGSGCKNRKRVFSELGADTSSSTDESGGGGGEDGSVSVGEPAAKGPVVGWPPVCSYRQRNGAAAPGKKAAYVKVSMDGAPILRKVDLHACNGYTDLTAAVDGLFGIDRSSRNEPEGSDYTQIYEDKEGDWMLVGDVPWGMFMEACRRLRLMKNSGDSRMIV